MNDLACGGPYPLMVDQIQVLVVNFCLIAEITLQIVGMVDYIHASVILITDFQLLAISNVLVNLKL